jgi:hypothetical protein
LVEQLIKLRLWNRNRLEVIPRKPTTYKVDLGLDQILREGEHRPASNRLRLCLTMISDALLVGLV